MKKKILSFLLLISLICLYSIPISAETGDETVATVNLTHTHTTNNVADNQTSKTGCYQTAYTVTVHTHSTGCYHYHSGSDQTYANGCYTKAYTSSSTATCSHRRYTPDRDGWQQQIGTCPWCGGNNGWVNVQWTTIAKNGTVANCGFCYSDGENVFQCTNCGRLYCTSANLGTSKIDGSTDTTYYHTVTVNTTRYTLGCGKSQGQLICTQPTTATRYKCTIAQGTKVGTYSLVKNKTNGYTLSAVSSGVTNVAYSWNTGATTQKINVIANGTYSCTLTWRDSSGVNRTSTLSYVVADYLQLNDVVWVTEPVNVDLMLNVQGVGIAKYSLDGTNWITTNTLTVPENGTYTVYVTTDANTPILSKEITITNIDKEKPTLEAHITNTEWQSATVPIEINGLDNVGLKCVYLNGELLGNITDTFTYEVPNNGIYEFVVEDTAKNKSEPFNVEVTNIDKSIPNLSLNAYNEFGEYLGGVWSTRDVTMTVIDSVEHPSGFTISWTRNGLDFSHSENEVTIEKGGLYTCTFRTGAGLSGTVSINAMIDKKPPIMVDMGMGKAPTHEVSLQISADDSEVD